MLLGDGAGMGKGRQIAGLIYHNVRQGRTKHIWFSASQDLKVKPLLYMHTATHIDGILS